MRTTPEKAARACDAAFEVLLAGIVGETSVAYFMFDILDRAGTSGSRQAVIEDTVALRKSPIGCFDARHRFLR
jgi:hypothetical protein